MKRNEHKRLKGIGWLMLASELLLALFAGSWLLAQYRQEEQRLHTDLGTIFIQTKDSLVDAVLDKEISGILEDSLNSNGNKIKFKYQFSYNSKTSGVPDSIIRDAPFDARQNIAVVKIGKDTGTLFIEKALRTAVTRTMASQDNLYRQFISSVDSVKLEKAFEQAVHNKNNSFRILKAGVPGRDSIFVFNTSDANDAYVKLDGYRSYLFKKIGPQIGFSLFLLLLSGLTFFMAYRNMWRQYRFGKQKDNFISNISHELKTPVSTTKVALEALSNFNALEDPKRSERYLLMANREMNRLEQLVERVMNTVQTEEGVLHLDKEPLELVALLKDIEESLLPAIQERKSGFTMACEMRGINVLADKMHLRGALYNIIDNAVKYGGHVIRVTVAMQEHMAQVRIYDDGTGIPVIYHNHVFDKFFRVPQGNRHDVKGHGLGLSYARYIIQAHGGSIHLASGTGQGTTFAVLLPLADKL